MLRVRLYEKNREVCLIIDAMPNDTVLSPQDAEVERERLTSLINSMGDGVIAVSQDLKIVLSNGAALNILDVNSSLPGKPLTRVLKLIDKNNQPIDLRKIIPGTHTSTASREWRLQYPDGSTVNLYVSI